MQRFLIIRLSSFGDIILSFPLLDLIKFYFPSANINYLTKPIYSEIVSLHKSISNIIEFDKNNLNSLRKSLKYNQFDYIFDLQNNFNSRCLFFLNKKNLFRYKKDYFRKFFLILFKINLFKTDQFVFKKYIDALNGLVKNIDLSVVKKQNLNLTYKKPFEFNYDIIAPASKHFTKTLPKEKFLEIITNNSNRKFVLVGSNNDNELEICNYLSNNSNNIINLCGDTSFKELTNLIFYCDYVLCNDSGVLHLAEYLEKKVICFFGSTVKQFGFYPRLKSSIIYENSKIKCRPCTKIGRDYCPKKHFRCMTEIDVSKIVL